MIKITKIKTIFTCILQCNLKMIDFYFIYIYNLCMLQYLYIMSICSIVIIIILAFFANYKKVTNDSTGFDRKEKACGRFTERTLSHVPSSRKLFHINNKSTTEASRGWHVRARGNAPTVSEGKEGRRSHPRRGTRRPLFPVR